MFSGVEEIHRWPQWISFIDMEEGQIAVAFNSDNDSSKVQPEDQPFTYLS